ncbi:hypothetical protein L1049_003944 [Liquidambar formosana]|uniref:Protein kinase domain-containing protein n=1 Tax=Liquidambar formosana TaxID=63359 RepID=A0AAP0RMK6_LIQFO
MRTAVTAQNDSPFLNISWPPYGPNFQYYIYMHFAELVDNQYREFNISLNGNSWVDQLVPQYLSTTTAYTRTPANAENFEFSLQKTQNSTLPPLINAMEIYVVKGFLQSQTDQGDVNAIMSIKSTYGVNRNSWQGDPCAPQAYSWDSLNCSYEGYDPPRIISLNLSSSGLSGEISSSISNLKLIQYLDLSNNSLTGPVPAFLSQLPSLMVLNLTVEKVAKAAARSNKKDVMIESKNQFTYSEILSLTNNFERVLGKGGFGTVYHGLLDDTQVAVKMLSSSSIQGYKQFHAEVNLLMRVHHRNLTSLIGYCDEGDNMGLIYEYMAKGNLQEHLSDRIPNILSWEQRLCIAIDAAQGQQTDELHQYTHPHTHTLIFRTILVKWHVFGCRYYVSNRLNEKSDVFGFGVVLLEIITSQPAITRNHEKIHISKWVSDTLTTKGDVRDVVDLRLRGDYDINSVWKAVEVATACVLPTSIKRPTMSHVVMELKQCLAAEIARKEGYETESKGPIEMVSLNLDTELVPLAR